MMYNVKRIQRLTLGILLSIGTVFALANNEPFTPKKDREALKKVAIEKDPSLPNVLLWGDSISIGYTGHVMLMMKGVANVSRIKGNAGDTNRGV